jgi:glycerophosphoryl diester phosphodiesterase
MRNPLILGHRGSPFTAPENTLASFRAALDEGADGVELDVQLTRDGLLVLHHDVEVAGRPVHQLTFAQLAGEVGHPLATLDDVLGDLPASAVVCVEFKRKGSVAELEAHERITALCRPRGDRTFDVSFDSWFLRACRHVAPDVPCGLIVDGKMLAGGFPAERLAFADWVSMDHALLDVVLEPAVAAGKKTLAWPVDSEADLARALARTSLHGLHGVITKRPALAVKLRG